MQSCSRREDKPLKRYEKPAGEIDYRADHEEEKAACREADAKSLEIVKQRFRRSYDNPTTATVPMKTVPAAVSAQKSAR